MDAETPPAFMDFKLVFRASDQPVKYEDPTRQYRFAGFKAKAQVEATIRVPAKSRAISAATARSGLPKRC